MQKERLKKEVVLALLESQEAIGYIADKMGVQFQTVLKQIISESPTLCKLPYVIAIKNALGLPLNNTITELYNNDGGYKE
jgi:predicted 3-demethylubiquinone-9 3-methyltransferase (glyoxalase superfamily)